uniref:CBS domain-containing protein CBSX1, chloroplastic n=1 Tax=Anthurium amnicola TaxID=1678845 RepID=A0A1D1XWL9_9ARAE
MALGSLLLADARVVLPCSLASAPSLSSSPNPPRPVVAVAPCLGPSGAVASPFPVRARSLPVKPGHLAAVGRGSALLTHHSAPSNNGVYTVGDFMTKRKDLVTVKPTTTIDEALQMLVEKRITGFPVIDDDWKLVRTSVYFSFLITPCLFCLYAGIIH